MEILLPLANFGIGGILLILLIRGDLVPKPVNQREITRGDTATDALQKTSEALKDISTINTKMSEQIGDLIDEVKDLRSQVQDLRGQVQSLEYKRAG
jgi:peptidoglycan hydrolase CwlO-like protein